MTSCSVEITRTQRSRLSVQGTELRSGIFSCNGTCTNLTREMVG